MKNYRRYLEDQQAELIQAIEDAENLQWHHADRGPQYDHYTRLMTWAQELHERGVWYDHIKALPERELPAVLRPKEIHPMDRQAAE